MNENLFLFYSDYVDFFNFKDTCLYIFFNSNLKFHIFK